MAGRDRPVAAFAPSLRSIKLYRDGRITYQGQSGSVVGTTASVDSSGSKDGPDGDTREVVLRIEGPTITIAASLPINGVQAKKHARQFAALINEMAMELGATNPTRPTRPEPRLPPSATWKAEVLEQLERLGRLRDSGVLTEDEFQAQKAGLLRSTPET